MAIKVRRSAKLVRVGRFGLSCAAVSLLVFVGLWAAAELPLGPTDLMVELFVPRGQETIRGLLEGVLVSALVGFLGGVAAESIYEGLCWLERR